MRRTTCWDNSLELFDNLQGLEGFAVKGVQAEEVCEFLEEVFAQLGVADGCIGRCQNGIK